MYKISEVIDLMENNPVILGIKDMNDISLSAKCESNIVFVLFGDISDIGSIVKELKDNGKTVFVNVDMVDGFSSKSSVIKFMKNNTEADGIVSSKAAMLRNAKELGFLTVHRFFILDSSSYRSMKKQLELSQADFINIAPGWTKVVEWTKAEYTKPIIASGLVCDKKIVIDSLKAGAVAICSTNHDVWDL